ncbi:DnaD domain protein [Syntrophomonas palmitatica]|uniref:DnaD domain-containing protein n=1 Tax=Syntrophomonas palmitatica TaxID=402877 RepID=UPI0006CFFEEB|nr:DnaD domain protein [Syntrophomonas palmitatica]
MADICRRIKRRSFTQIDNEPINDPDLKYEDIGLLAYVMSKPDDWVFYKNELINNHGNGRESVGGIFNRLEAKGYLLVIKRKNEKGQFTNNEYIFTDVPFDFGDIQINNIENNNKPQNPHQTGISPVNGKPSTGSRQRETVNGNPSTTNTIYSNTINNNNVVVLDEIQKIFLEKLNQEMPDSLAEPLGQYTLSEIHTVVDTLIEKKRQGRISTPIGVLLKNPHSVISRILSGSFYPTGIEDSEYTTEILEFEKYTGINLSGKVRQDAYKTWRAKFSKEMVFKAGELAAKNSKTGGIEYINAVLNDWEKRNVQTPEQTKRPRKTQTSEYVTYVPV